MEWNKVIYDINYLEEMFKCRQEEGNYIVKVLLEPSTGNAYAGARDQHIGVGPTVPLIRATDTDGHRD